MPRLLFVFVSGLSSSDLHSVQDLDPTGNVPQGLDRHAVGHQQVSSPAEDSNTCCFFCINVTL